MNTFVNTISSQTVTTENGAKAFSGTGSACVDLFGAIGASRGKNIIPKFVAAYVENKEIAARIALWARDVRGGAGERKIFRDILAHLAVHDTDLLERMVPVIPEIGRFDDLLAVDNPISWLLFRTELLNGNALAAKWAPREGSSQHAKAIKLMNMMNLSPRNYRKLLASATKVVESQMCKNDWDGINFNHVPSIASKNYAKAFDRHTPKYKEWVSSLSDPTSGNKINASAIFPYDVLPRDYFARPDSTEVGRIQAQWDALPDYMNDHMVLPMIDVSGSMECAAGNTKMTCMHIAISLGMYMADKNKGVFKNGFLTFDDNPKLQYANGNIIEKLHQIAGADWGGSTNIGLAFDRILEHAVQQNVPPEFMPETLVVLSDMQFDENRGSSGWEMAQKSYAQAGYKLPKIVFWNLRQSDNYPIKISDEGVAMVSGFSPAILTSVLSGKDLTPESVMLEAVMKPRYNI